MSRRLPIDRTTFSPRTVLAGYSEQSHTTFPPLYFCTYRGKEAALGARIDRPRVSNLRLRSPPDRSSA